MSKVRYSATDYVLSIGGQVVKSTILTARSVPRRTEANRLLERLTASRCRMRTTEELLAEIDRKKATKGGAR